MKQITLVNYTVIVPFFNEAGNVRPLVEQIVFVLSTIPGTREILLIDDGSTDDTPADLTAVVAGMQECRLIRFAKNRGQAAALLEGLRQAQGNYILTLDGDGQNDPLDLPRVLAPVVAGEADLVCGIRTPRHDSALRRLMSRLANTVRRRILRDGLHDAGCQLRAFRREIIPVLQPSPLLQAFLPAMAVAAGFRIAEMPVRHHPRKRGKSKYGLRRLWWQPAVEMLRLRRTLSRSKIR